MEDLGGHYTLTGEDIDAVYDEMKDKIVEDQIEEARKQENFCN